MKVIIAGSRSLMNCYDKVRDIIFNYNLKNPITEVVSGGAKGVDTYGEVWAETEGIRFIRFDADWNSYGRSAGYLRNGLMGNYADALLAIWDGKSRGTKHMIQYMEHMYKPVEIVVLQPTTLSLTRVLPKLTNDI